MISLQALRDHAASKPEHTFHLNDCEKCLAADLTGKTMAGHTAFSDGKSVPPALASFTRGASCARYDPLSPFASLPPGDPKRLALIEGHATGAQIAKALDGVLAGRDPYLAGMDMMLNG